MEPFVEILKEINIAQIFIIFFGMWIIYNRAEKKNDNLRQDIKDLETRLISKIDDVDRRLCRIEGSLATQGHCLFSHKQQDRKAE